MAALLIAALLPSVSAWAGGGPENVVVVVNARSWASKSIANYYVELRDIPRRNVVYVDWDGRLLDGTTIEPFRQKILIPVLEAIDAQGLASQADYIVYSSDFPTTIGLAEDLKGQQVPQQLTPIASINALTYYFQYVLLKTPGYLNLGPERYSNFYFRRRSLDSGDFPSRGFRRWYGWNQQGDLLEAGGQSFFLSTMLGVTTGRGNSVSEVRNYLRASRAADGTHPKGTIYFMDNADPRSSERRSGKSFPGAPTYEESAAALKKLGVNAIVLPGTVPQNKTDVAGLMMGSEKFDWAATRSKILPGAICENLTSFGGIFDDVANQTPLTEFLRFGAAGSSGTVVEPFLILQKFPSPYLQVHYARGCSLAESFYQSVAGPYQLLIVGDALCQPWANVPKVSVAGVTANAEVKGSLTLRPQATVPQGGAVHLYTLYLDGRAVSDCAPGESFTLDTRRTCDGYHLLSVVAVEKSPIESQGRWQSSIRVNNQGSSCQLVATPGDRSLVAGRPLKLAVDAPGAAKIRVLQNTRVLGTVEGASGTLDVDTRELGFGPVEISAVAVVADPVRELATSVPLKFDVRPTKSLEPVVAPARLRPGILLTLANGSSKAIGDTNKHDWLQLAGVQPQAEYTLAGYVDVPREDVYQFQLAHFGSADLRVNNNTIYQGNDSTNWPAHYVPVALKPGKHRVEVRGKAARFPRLDLRFGGPGAWRAGDKNFQHE